VGPQRGGAKRGTERRMVYPDALDPRVREDDTCLSSERCVIPVKAVLWIHASEAFGRAVA
jgi:hypothetical protein